MPSDSIEHRITETLSEIRGLVERQENEIAQNRETSSTTARALDDATRRLDEINTELQEQRARVDSVEAQAQRVGGGSSYDLRTVGERFAESDQYQQWLTGGAAGQSQPFPIGSFNRRTLQSGDPIATGQDAYLWQPQRVEGIIGPVQRPERVRDLFPVVPTNSDIIEFVRESGFTNSAATVPEYSDTDVTEKPQSALTFELDSAKTVTIAHWIPATRRMMQNVPAMSGYVNTRLLDGINIVEDAQLLHGGGLGTDMLGLTNTPNVQTYQRAAGDEKIDAIRRAATRVRLAEYRASGVVVNPIDWEDIELTKGSDKHYVWVTVGEGGQQRVWRMPVVETTAMDEGDFLVGSFALGATVWDREQSTIRVADQHAGYFTKNMLAILAEESLALTVYRPEAFVVGDFTEAQ